MLLFVLLFEHLLVEVLLSDQLLVLLRLIRHATPIEVRGRGRNDRAVDLGGVAALRQRWSRDKLVIRGIVSAGHHHRRVRRRYLRQLLHLEVEWGRRCRVNQSRVDAVTCHRISGGQVDRRQGQSVRGMVLLQRPASTIGSIALLTTCYSVSCMGRIVALRL